ncbi:MAG: aspartate carbamoyltransferase [Variovorax sp.]|nr:aspartate carbamoyltransferase [Variovorax sp.]
MTNRIWGVVVAALILLPLSSQAADPTRQAEIARRGGDVMLFDLKATTHIFTKTAEGGLQRIVAKNAADKRQVALVRAHLREIQGEFLKGDFSGPSHIHGEHMPGLAQLEAAAPGKIAIDYREVAGGAELTYRTADPKLVSSLHDWFDAQLSDHGPDAMAGHHHMHDEMPQR